MRPVPMVAVFLVVTAYGCHAWTAEIRLKKEAVAAAAMVTLGDVADVFSADPAEAEQLRDVALFPAPPPGRERFVRVRELHDLLLLRGVNLAEHHFSGASQARVAAGEPIAAETPQEPTTAAQTRGAKSRITEALKAHLMARVSAETPWQVEVELSDSLIHLLADSEAELHVDGGAPPWVGSQQFQVRLATSEENQEAAVEARVSIPASVVVAARSLPRGVVLHAGDLQLCQAEWVQDRTDVFPSVDHVVGKETTRSIPAGKVVTADSVQAPLFVRRGEVVTVHAHAAGIRIRTQGRARDDGSDGDLVAVESLETREMFFARVCGVREVEVFARAARLDASGTAGAMPTARR